MPTADLNVSPKQPLKKLITQAGVSKGAAPCRLLYSHHPVLQIRARYMYTRMAHPPKVTISADVVAGEALCDLKPQTVTFLAGP